MSKCFPRSGRNDTATVLPVGTELGKGIAVDVAVGGGVVGIDVDFCTLSPVNGE